MDWGLAKVLPQGRRRGRRSRPGWTIPKSMRPSSPPNHARRIDPEGDHSRAGSVLGTPSVHGPRAGPGRDRPARRAGCDVFALGSILCRSPDRPAGVRRAEQRPRSSASRPGATWPRHSPGSTSSGAEASLAGLAKDCLAAEPEDRPAVAQEVADRLLDHINSLHRRLRDAELAQAAEHARAEEAKRTDRGGRGQGHGRAPVSTAPGRPGGLPDRPDGPGRRRLRLGPASEVRAAGPKTALADRRGPGRRGRGSGAEASGRNPARPSRLLKVGGGPLGGSGGPRTPAEAQGEADAPLRGPGARTSCWPSSIASKPPPLDQARQPPMPTAPCWPTSKPSGAIAPITSTSSGPTPNMPSAFLKAGHRPR